MKRLLVLMLLMTATARAQVISVTSRGIVVATPDEIRLFDSSARRTIWSARGVSNPSIIVRGEQRIAVIDSLRNLVSIADLSTGAVTRVATGETPVAGVFIDADLFLLDRDARLLERITPGGVKSVLELDADPAFIRASRRMLYVYSRMSGVVQEIGPRLQIMRSVRVAPFASDFEIEGRTGYLVDPRAARLHTFSVITMQATGDIEAGVVPVDLTVARESNAVSATSLAIADPSAKRVWRIEGAQSVTSAVTRGFLRGLLGLGLFAPSSAEFPTGVDRVSGYGSAIIAYDTSTGTLYRVNRKKSSVLARGIAPGAFSVGEHGIAVLENGRLRLLE